MKTKEPLICLVFISNIGNLGEEPMH
ncbi:uncharacterized protein METZ01_LOCUS211851 [marine metagenome]|uniref:Uncharacterized protein n=1 Tax=marine metagenome TaxID=408172 RepID=A0A382FA83_9ZZZZ